MSNTYTLTEEHGEKVNNAINTSHVEETKTPTIMRITASVNIDGTWAERIDEKGAVIRDPSGKIERDYTPVDASDLAAARQLVPLLYTTR